jgi:hypothetical protein
MPGGRSSFGTPTGLASASMCAGERDGEWPWRVLSRQLPNSRQFLSVCLLPLHAPKWPFRFRP